MKSHRAQIFDWQSCDTPSGAYSCSMAFNFAPVTLFVCPADDKGLFTYYLEWKKEDVGTDDSFIMAQGYAEGLEKAQELVELIYLEARMK